MTRRTLIADLQTLSTIMSTRPSTPLRTTLYNLDLLLSPPPAGLGYQTLSRVVPGRVLINWVISTAKLANNVSQAIEILEDMERVGGLNCVRGVGEDGHFVHCGAKMIAEHGVLNRYLSRGTAVVRGVGGSGSMDESWSVDGYGCEIRVAGVTVDQARGLESMAKRGIVEAFNDAWKGLCEDCLQRDGHEVVYDKIRESKWWPMALEMVHRIGEIADIDALRNDISENGWECLCFNLYNFLVWHGKLVLGSPTSLAGRGKFFDGAKYWLGGVDGIDVSLSEWEHGILRRKWADAAGIKRALVLKVKDPRMHFILNCGAQSCPPIVPLDLVNSEKQIEQNTRTFIEKNCIMDRNRQTVTLSRLWKWFRVDFTPKSKSSLELLRWIQSHASEEKQNALEYFCVKLTIGAQVKIKFMRYNWADNGDWNAKPDDHFMYLYDLSFKRNE